MACLNQVYDHAATGTAEQVMEDLSADTDLDRLGDELSVQLIQLLDATDEAPVIRLVNSLLFQAVSGALAISTLSRMKKAWLSDIESTGADRLSPPKRLQASMLAGCRSWQV